MVTLYSWTCEQKYQHEYQLGGPKYLLQAVSCKSSHTLQHMMDRERLQQVGDLADICTVTSFPPPPSPPPPLHPTNTPAGTFHTPTVLVEGKKKSPRTQEMIIIAREYKAKGSDKGQEIRQC